MYFKQMSLLGRHCDDTFPLVAGIGQPGPGSHRNNTRWFFFQRYNLYLLFFFFLFNNNIGVAVKEH